MIIGKGLVAKAFEKYNSSSICFFCSGVSDSKTSDESQFLREKNLLELTFNQIDTEVFVYISTYSVNDPFLKNTAYIQHKLQMEALILAKVKNYLIVRTSNLIGNGGNKKTILPFLVHHIKNKIPFDAWSNASRNILDVDDLAKITSIFLEEKANKPINEIINVLGLESYLIKNIITIIENHLGMKANCNFLEKGENFEYDVALVEKINKIHKIFKINYLQSILEKYF